MKWLFRSADNYLKQSSWKDMALLKVCLFAMGLFAGLQIPKKHKKPAAFAAFAAFILTYPLLMYKYFKVVYQMIAHSGE